MSSARVPASWTPVDRAFLSRPSVEVAPQLLGKILHLPASGVAARIIEVEAYAEHEPACHAHRGQTPANATLFGPAGHLYVYFTYGMHFCANTVTGPAGSGEGVLLRAGAPLIGEDLMRARREAGARRVTDRDLLRGPARLAKALGIGRSHDGKDLVAGSAPDLPRLMEDGTVPSAIAQGPRVGVRLAADLPWRWWLADDPRVSPYRRHPRAPSGS